MSSANLFLRVSYRNLLWPRRTTSADGFPIRPPPVDPLGHIKVHNKCRSCVLLHPGKQATQNIFMNRRSAHTAPG